MRILRYMAFLSAAWMAFPVYAQVLDDQPQTKTDLSDPGLISRPPMDPYSLSYTPDKPAGARDLIDEAACKAAGGSWKLIDTDDEIDTFSIIDDVPQLVTYPLKLAGCVINGKNEGRWMYFHAKNTSSEPAPKKSKSKKNDVKKQEIVIKPEDSVGYVWFVDGRKSGWDVILKGHGDFVRKLRHYEQGILDGTSFEWDDQGVLEQVKTYKNGIFDGRFEQYSSCLPSYTGQYKDGKPVGKWEFYGEPGQIDRIVDFNRRASKEDLPANMPENTLAFWTEWYTAKGTVQKAGFSIINTEQVLLDEGRHVGKTEYRSGVGSLWLTVNYGNNGGIDDPDLVKICKPEDEPNRKNVSGFRFDHDNLVISCMDEHDEAYRKVYYYGSSEIWKTEPISNSSVNGIVREYHPTGEILAEYKVVDNIPEGSLIFMDREGKVMGVPESIQNKTGNYRAWWHTGALREEGRYHDGKKMGVWKTWFETGTLQKEENYLNDEQNGRSQEWYANGVLATDMNFSLGVPDGKNYIYYPDGKIGLEVTFKYGRMVDKYLEYTHGGQYKTVVDYSSKPNKSVTYYSSGEKKSEGEVFSMWGSPEKSGRWKYYLQDGKTVWFETNYSDSLIMTLEAMACREHNGSYEVYDEQRAVGCSICQVNRKEPRAMSKVREGEWLWYNERGLIEKKGSIRLGHMEGLWEYFYPNGKPMLSGEYNLDRKTGLWRAYFDNGSKKFEGEYKDGVESGLWITYSMKSEHPTSRGNYDAGKKTGEWKWFYDNGQVREEGSYDNGAETGVWTTWYESGNKKGSGSYVNGNRSGLWTWWREDGNVWKTANYVDGKEKNE